jgi:hypothetical protein
MPLPEGSKHYTKLKMTLPNLKMKSIRLLACVVLLAQAALAQNPPGLVSAYSFNEGTGTVLNDVSGNTNNGTISNATWSASGKYGSALSFNGSTSRVDILDSTSLHLTTGLTMEAWVRPTTLSAWRTVLMKEQTGGLVYGLYANSDTNRPSAHVNLGSESDTRGTAKLSVNTWTHLAATYDGSVLRLYVNGTQVSTRTLGGSILTSTSALRIGGNSIWGEYFAGLIDEVRIYNRALTTAEIQTDMNTAIGGAPPTDTTPPTVSMTAPTNGATVSGNVTVSANASDNVAVAGVQFLLDGTPLGSEDTAAPYSVSWNTATATNAPHTLAARARDAAGNQTTSTTFTISVNNTTPPGLVSAYSFNEGTGTVLNDLSGNNNNGTISNTTWSASGKFGAALSFNGTSSWVVIPNSASLDLTNGLTMEAWVSPSTLSSWRTVLMKEQTGGLAYSIYANSDTNRPSAHVFIGAETDTRGTAQLALNTWTHLAATYDGSVLRLYVNGAQVSTRTIGGNILTSTSPLRIGGNSIWGEYFSGLIDEVRIYNRALTASQIQTDMNTAISGTPPPPDTTPPTVSVTAPADGATVAGAVTLSANASDNVLVVGVQFNVDGSPVGSEITSPPFTTSWNTATTTDGVHKITAVARDGANNQTTSTLVSVTVNNGNSSSISGAWTAPFNWPIVAINMVVTRTGEVMSWDGPPSNGGTSAQLWNPSTGAFSPIPNNATNMFCNAAVVLADGRVLAIGGHADWGVGLRNTDMFDPITKLWSFMAPMHYGRWYPTATVLPDGRVLAISGGDTCETCIASIPEIYNPTTNTWTALTTAPFSVALYPFMFVLPDGRVLEAGATRAAVDTRVLDLTTNNWTVIDNTLRDGHSAVMYELGKIMKSGSSADVSVSTAPSASTTFTLDMTQPSPKWQQTANMAFPRSFHNLTLLPDGSVLTTGGGSTKDGVNYANSVLAAELWSPVTKTWSTMSSMQVGRLYHGTAVLLLDGRVLVAGSGRAGPEPQFSAEIYSPPYLFKGPRPTISSIPAEATYGSTFFMGSPDASAITSVTLLRISAATHAFNMDQRFLRLNFSQTAGGLNVVAPASGNVAPPGYYVLYGLNSAGVPSVGAVIRIH